MNKNNNTSTDTERGHCMLFHDWSKWVDSTFVDINTGIKRSSQDRRCLRCNKSRTRIITGERS